MDDSFDVIVTIAAFALAGSFATQIYSSNE